jgi:hypothetical protein
MHIRFRALPVVGALVVSLLAGGGSSFAQDKKGAPKIDKAQQAEINAAIKIIDDAIKGQTAPTDFRFTFTNHSMKSRDAKTYVPFLLTFDKGQTFPQPAVYYVRVVSKENLVQAQKAIAEHEEEVQKAAMAAKLDPENTELAEEEDRVRAKVPKVEYAFEDFKTINFNKPNPDSLFMLPSVMAVVPGTYDAYVLIKETVASVKGKKVPAKAGLLKVALTVPNYDTGELTTSSIVLTKMVQQLKAAPTEADLQRNPFVFGPMAVMPSLDFKFSKNDELTILFYVYNVGVDKTTGKPDLTIDYNFYRKADGAEKFFNKTPTLILNATTLAPTFDLKAGHQLNGGQGLPLSSFDEGEYRVEIKILDKATGKTKIQNCTFTVTAG